MASSLTSLIPALAVKASSQKQPDKDRRKPPASVSRWWAPLFGWSAEPSYLSDGSADVQTEGFRPDPAGSRFPRGCFTEDKAKQLRRMTAEGKTFHDIMYHSAIASRLASEMPDQSIN
ncbi:hypothetical protein SAY86_026480 [Trapa natans]|uniref:Uncharacterized protein n=1 Tax=Trapa natans TaxID=22666 RepID=A0AAN7KE08_TRANT|nr:hypothetical protein SAY86_026480 [Trapa natans]